MEITGSVNPLKIGKKYLQTADAFEFISLIRNADFVVTSSFHGTAFSIIFEKQFYVIGLGKKAGRVESLLKIVGLENHLLESDNGYRKDKIDYNIVKQLLFNHFEYSKNYLKKLF